MTPPAHSPSASLRYGAEFSDVDPAFDPPDVNPASTKEYESALEERITSRVMAAILLADTERVFRPFPRETESAISEPMTAGEIDAKIAAAEARTDTKFEALRGDLKAIVAATSGTKGTVIGTGLALAALVVGLMAYGADRFGDGMDSSAIANQAAQRAIELALPRQSLGTVNQTPVGPAAAN